MQGIDGLDGAVAVTISPDGKHLYAAGALESAVAAFSVAQAITPVPVPGVTSWGLIMMAAAFLAILLRWVKIGGRARIR